IEITQESIGEMLGIRNEGVDIMEVEDANDEEMVQNWVDQFEEGKKITPGAVNKGKSSSKLSGDNNEEPHEVCTLQIAGDITSKDYDSPVFALGQATQKEVLKKLV
nr:major facilitator superfamily domain, general substrate transporter [Tanacetum cinerariifolium]